MYLEVAVMLSYQDEVMSGIVTNCEVRGVTQVVTTDPYLHLINLSCICIHSR